MRTVIAGLIVMTSAACTTPTATVATTTPSATAAPQSASATPRASTSPALTPAVSLPTPPPPIVDLAQVFRPMTAGWRPSGPTLMVVSTEDFAATLVALPIGPAGLAGAATPLVRFLGAWDLSSDGRALAVAVGTDRGLRIATIDLGTMTSRWVTPAAPGSGVSAPVWSKDRAAIYMSTVGSAPPDFRGSVGRIAADTGAVTTIATLDRFGGLDGVTPDGGGLVWSRIQAGGSVDILDVATGVSRHLEDVARLTSVRARQPRMLLTVGGCCAGRPGGALVLWNDVAMTSQRIAEVRGGTAWGIAVWDPSGTRIAAVRFDDADPYQGSTVVLDPDSGAATTLAGGQGGRPLVWIDEGIVLARQNGVQTDLTLLPSGGGSPATLFSGPNINRIVLVRP